MLALVLKVSFWGFLGFFPPFLFPPNISNNHICITCGCLKRISKLKNIKFCKITLVVGEWLYVKGHEWWQVGHNDLVKWFGFWKIRVHQRFLSIPLLLILMLDWVSAIWMCSLAPEPGMHFSGSAKVSTRRLDGS